MTLYHVGSIYPKQYLFLNKLNSSEFQWVKALPLSQEEPTPCKGSTAAKAIQSAYKLWGDHDFRLLHCGFRYTLPERDEVGCNAFFWQMAQSYASASGRYFDEETGHLCYVDFASQEALELWRKIR
ncbi:MAG: hypothetical protein S4CHLAM2_07070 [Chlamydiales bacterium]|nr:hypothetical protein [Chlamydiales bacterium]